MQKIKRGREKGRKVKRKKVKIRSLAKETFAVVSTDGMQYHIH